MPHFHTLKKWDLMINSCHSWLSLKQSFAKLPQSWMKTRRQPTKICQRPHHLRCVHHLFSWPFENFNPKKQISKLNTVCFWCLCGFVTFSYPSRLRQVTNQLGCHATFRETQDPSKGPCCIKVVIKTSTGPTVIFHDRSVRGGCSPQRLQLSILQSF